MKNFLLIILPFLFTQEGLAFDDPTPKQLAAWLKRFPRADTNGDGKLTVDEASAFREKMQRANSAGKTKGRKGAPSKFSVDPGWKLEQFPEHAVCYRSPDEIKELYAKLQQGKRQTVVSFPKPDDGSLRIVGTGHSFMAPGYQTFPTIARAAGFQQPPLLTHTGGGMTGSARYKWEQENGIFQFDGKPVPKLLCSICNAQWDAMMWGPYYNDQPEYYACWIDFCRKHNPHMKFYLSDAWPQLEQMKALPTSESELTPEVFATMGEAKNVAHNTLIKSLRENHSPDVFIMPTNDAMVLSVDYYHNDKLPGVEGVHTLIGKKERSLWRDHLGHLGPGFGNLEGYVFYATIYGRSPELIETDINLGSKNGYPSPALDRVFREIAWQAVINHPLSGVVDQNNNGLNDVIE